MSEQKKDRPAREDVRPMFNRADNDAPRRRPIVDHEKAHKIPGTALTALAFISGGLGLLALFSAVVGESPAAMFAMFGFLLVAGVLTMTGYAQRSAFELALIRRMMEQDRGRQAPKIEGHVR